MVILSVELQRTATLVDQWQEAVHVRVVVESILREVEFPEASRERVSAVLERIAVEKAEFERRFPLPRGDGDKLEEPKSEADEESRDAGSRDCPSEEETTQSESSLTGTSA